MTKVDRLIFVYAEDRGDKLLVHLEISNDTELVEALERHHHDKGNGSDSFHSGKCKVSVV